jgi:hypothetical protein
MTRDWWASASPDQREEMKRRSWQGFRARHPDRADLIERTRAAIDAGTLVPQPCDICGEPARPLFDWASLTLAGWRCLACRMGSGMVMPNMFGSVFGAVRTGSANTVSSPVGREKEPVRSPAVGQGMGVEILIGSSSERTAGQASILSVRDPGFGEGVPPSRDSDLAGPAPRAIAGAGVPGPNLATPKARG